MRGFLCRNLVKFGKEINHSPAFEDASFGKAIKPVVVCVERKTFLFRAFRTFAATLAAQKLESLFFEYELSKRDLLKAIKETDWAKLHNEILELEIKKGKDEIDAEYYTTIETNEDVEIFLANIRRRGLRRLKAKQKIKNHSTI